MATQKAVTEHVKDWLAASTIKEATEAASKAASEFNGLYTESAKNLLARQPDLMNLLSAYQAGRAAGMAEEAARHRPVQEALEA